MTDNWKNEDQNKSGYDKNQQGGQHDPSQRPGQSGQTGQTSRTHQGQKDNPSQSDQNNPQRKAS